MGRSIVQGEAIGAMLAPILATRGYVLVRALLTTKGGRVLQVMVERLDELSMSVDNCVEVSGVVSEALDVESPIEGTYQLEVSSPGIERPLMNEEDFRRYMGYDVSVTLSKGCKEIRGRIVEATEGGVALACEGIERRTISYAQISKAKLLLTDSLLKAAPNVKR